MSLDYFHSWSWLMIISTLGFWEFPPWAFEYFHPGLLSISALGFWSFPPRTLIISVLFFRSFPPQTLIISAYGLVNLCLLQGCIFLRMIFNDFVIVIFIIVIIFSCDGEGCGSMLVEFHTTKGFNSEETILN